MFKLRLNFFAVIGVVALASFLLNIEMTARHTAASFYSPQTRFWELLIGSALAYLFLYKTQLLPKPHSVAAHLLSFAGVALITVAALMIHKEFSFPGLVRRSADNFCRDDYFGRSASLVESAPVIKPSFSVDWFDSLPTLPVALALAFICAHCGRRKAKPHDFALVLCWLQSV